MLKLFVWSKVEALRDYSPGECYALAETKEDAIRLIVDSVSDYPDFSLWRKVKKELQRTEPEVFEAPVGFYRMGGA